MDPFRDELGAAHAKNAQLEERVRSLESALRSANDARNAQIPARKPMPVRSRMLMVMMVFFVFVALGGVLSLLLSRGHGSSPSSEPSYKGIATEPGGNDNAVSPTTEARTHATAAATSSAKPCKCEPGDPLCSCL